MAVFRNTGSYDARIGMLVDLILCFVAVLLAASTLTTTYAAVQRTVPELPLTLFGAALFAVVMALMYALVGLYRPRPIRVLANLFRTVLALAAGGYLTCVALRSFADRSYVEQLIPAAVAYLVGGLILARIGLHLMLRFATLSRVLIVGTGPEAYRIASDLKSPGRMARNVVGLFPTSNDEEAPTEASLSAPHVFPKGSSITELVSRYDINEIIVAVREQRGGCVPMDQLLQCRIGGIPFWISPASASGPIPRCPSTV